MAPDAVANVPPPPPPRPDEHLIGVMEKPRATAAQEVAHITFNPTPMGLHSPLAAVCDDYERSGWRLVQVVPHHQYESVAVFMREA